jgi:hypothetical protein
MRVYRQNRVYSSAINVTAVALVRDSAEDMPTKWRET